VLGIGKKICQNGILGEKKGVGKRKKENKINAMKKNIVNFWVTLRKLERGGRGTRKASKGDGEA